VVFVLLNVSKLATAPLIVKLSKMLVVPPANKIEPMAVFVRPLNLLEPVTVSAPVPPWFRVG